MQLLVVTPKGRIYFSKLENVSSLFFQTKAKLNFLLLSAYNHFQIGIKKEGQNLFNCWHNWLLDGTSFVTKYSKRQLEYF